MPRRVCLLLLLVWASIGSPAYGQDSVTDRVPESIDGETLDEASAARARTTIEADSAPRSPDWFSVMPPVVAILIALVLRSVIPALFIGVWLGAWGAAGLTLGGFWQGLLDAFQVYVRHAVADPDHVAVILFSLMIGGMVGIVSRNGGTRGIVEHIVGWANTPRRGQLATALLGIILFIDDYANSLVVGNTMRPVTDRLRISREKLAYLVDSTAAPVSCLALVTTWIGYEVGLIGAAIASIDDLDTSPYLFFLRSLPYSFYPLLALFLLLWVAHTGRDIGPMFAAERHARRHGISHTERDRDAAAEMSPSSDRPHRALNALIPMAVLVFGVVGGLYATGEGGTLLEIIGTADAYKALMWASLLGVVVAAVLSLSQRLLSVNELVEAWHAGVKSMLYAMIILVLAWALSATTKELGTAEFLVSILSDRMPTGILPLVVFVLAAATAFATGSSWGTMGILMPLVIPLGWSMIGPGEMFVLYSSVSAVLAGAVWGDHCSPISDTTILSSMASGCDHVEHVRTQLPYALLAGFVAALFGVLPSGFGMPWWLSLAIGTITLVIALRVLGRHTDPLESIAEAEATGGPVVDALEDKR